MLADIYCNFCYDCIQILKLLGVREVSLGATAWRRCLLSYMSVLPLMAEGGREVSEARNRSRIGLCLKLVMGPTGFLVWDGYISCREHLKLNELVRDSRGQSVLRLLYAS